MDDVITAGHALENYSSADSASLLNIGYMALEDRYKALQVSMVTLVYAYQSGLFVKTSVVGQNVKKLRYIFQIP